MSEAWKMKGPIAWMANNRVASNLLMFTLIVGGILGLGNIRREVFPQFELDMVTIRVPYPGATPEDVEQGILLAIEDVVRGVDGVRRITSTASESVGAVSIEIIDGANSNTVLQDIKNEIDRITSFPEEIEEPIISLAVVRRPVLSIILYGDVDEMTLRDLAEQVRVEVAGEDGITLAEVSGTRPLEISIEVPLSRLREHGMTLDYIARQVRQTSLELGGGGVKTPGGELLVRVAERRDHGVDHADIPVISTPSGELLLLSDIADIKDGFADVDQITLYNGQKAVNVTVYRVGDEDPIEVSRIAKSYVERLRQRLPDGIAADVINDRSDIYGERIQLLVKNAAIGLILVVIILGLFLEVRLAFWVTMGIPISFVGALLLMPYFDVSINMISLFAFIITVGIVVDDAIVVGESIYYERGKKDGLLPAAVRGTEVVAVPVVFAILTNIIAFMPMLFVPGMAGQMWRNIPVVIIIIFSVSLIEALFILPSHLAHQRVKAEGFFWRTVEAPQRFFGRQMQLFVDKKYNPFVEFTLRHRYITVALGLAMLIATLGWWIGGRLQYTFFPRIESDMVRATVVMPFGTPFEQSIQIERDLRESAWRVLERNGGEDILEGIYSTIGSHPGGRGPFGGSSAGGSHLTGVEVNLVPLAKRDISAREFMSQWRREAPPIAGVESLEFRFNIGPQFGSPIDIEISHPETQVLEEVAQRAARILEGYAGLVEISDGIERGKEQFSFTLKPAARSLGITSLDLARQLRNAFYGAEARRQQRGADEIKVFVRLPRSERRYEDDIMRLMIKAPNGAELTLAEAAEIERGRSYQQIRRTEGRRTLNVTADLVSEEFSAQSIVEDLRENIMPQIQSEYPGLSFSLEGEQREQRQAMGGLLQGFVVALFGLFALLSIIFKSYAQAVVVLMAIPFGIVGAVVGHIIMGFSMSFVSAVGIVALAGVVINDNILLIDTANKYRAGGMSARQAASEAPTRRFRPVILTSMTTFLGLAPMIFETSIQARFMIPMAISLGFGIIFSTLITLVLVPSLYMISEDIKGIFAKSGSS